MEKFEKSFSPKQDLDFRREAWKHIVDNVEHHEREKSLAETEVIRDADNRTSQIIKSYGIQAISVTPDIVHLIKAESWIDGHAFFSREQGLFIRETQECDQLSMPLVHEMFHYKGVNYLPVPLTEAIIERLTAQALNLENKNLSGSQVFSGIYTYPDFRLILDGLLSLIKSRTPEGATNDFHSFSFFARAHLAGSTGQLEFLNKIFGPGTLDGLLKLNDDPDSLSSFVKNL